MLKRTLCAILALLMVAGTFPLAVLAEEVIVMDTVTVEGIAASLTGMTDIDSDMHESENNNSRSRADYIKNDMTLVSGTVGGSSDTYDFFKITLKQSAYLEMRAISGTGKTRSTKFRLCSSSGKVLKTASFYETVTTNGNSDDLYTMEYTMAPGTYYIRVNETRSRTRSEYQFKFLLYPALDAPSDVEGDTVSSSGKPEIEWDAVAGVKNYRIYRATSKSGSYKYLDSTKDTSYVDTTAKAGSSYYYKVKAMSGDSYVRDSRYSSVVKVTCDCARPEVWLTHRSTTGKNIVKWDEVDGAEKYEVYCATRKTGTYKRIGTTSRLQLIHKSGASDKMYYYKVRAINEKTSAANSAYSVVVGQRTK